MEARKGVLYLLLMVSSTHGVPSINQAPCLPKFPTRSGWLGGDNALSIPLSSGKTLWLFSDSFVGPSDILDRSLSILIANTAAISSCQSDGMRLEYYWKKTKNGNPAPIFEPLSNEFKYWPTEAFEYENHLYVVLHKVKPGPEANQDDLFNFSLVGTTLAEVKNFKETPPDQWQISYIEWPEVFDPNEWNAAMTVHEDYLYVFIGRRSQQYNLVRVPLAHVRQPGFALEYYSNANTWKPGYEKSSALVVLHGSAGGSIKFHKKISKWVMIYGPEFLEGHILKRTADKITGPWSAPQNIYEVPELAKDNPTSHPKYFAYGAREHSAFYDEPNGLLCITYDCNSSDFNVLLNTLEIYTPRVIQLETAKD